MFPLLVGLLVLGWRVTAAETLPAAHFLGNAETTQEAPEGWVHLDWAEPEGGLPEGARFELERSALDGGEGMTPIYAGRDTATFVSGLPEGTYRFRLRVARDAAAGPWSPPLVLQVEYVDRSLVWGLMLAGAFGFLATALTLVVNHRRVRTEHLSS